MTLHRRRFLLAAPAALVACAQPPHRGGHAGHEPLYERLDAPGRMGAPELATQQHVFDSPVPRAATPGRWIARAPLPLPRSEMAWAAAVGGRMHLVGGYGEQRVDRPFGGRVDSFHTNSNLHHTYEALADKWTARNPLPTARSGHGAVLVGQRIFVMGGEGTNRVYGQNEAYDLGRDRWEQYAPMATPRHGLGAVAIGNTIYVAGGGPVMGGGVQSAVHEAFLVP